MQAAGWKRGTVALLCVYALVLHAVLLALGSGLSAAPSPLPVHVLCAPGGTSAPDSPGKPEHGPICCALGCLASANGVPPAASAFLPVRNGHFAETAFLPPPAPAALTSRHAYPLGARAPPVLA